MNIGAQRIQSTIPDKWIPWLIILLSSIPGGMCFKNLNQGGSDVIAFLLWFLNIAGSDYYAPVQKRRLNFLLWKMCEKREKKFFLSIFQKVVWKRKVPIKILHFRQGKIFVVEKNVKINKKQ